LSEERITTGPEWRAFTAEEKKKRSRAGAPVRYAIHDKGLSTTIGRGNRDSSGKKLSSKRRAEIHRLRRWQIRSWIHNSKERNLNQALNELNRLASQLELKKSVKEHAAMIYRKALFSGVSPRRSIDATVAAVIYAACRLRQIPRSLKEIAKHSRISWKKIGHHYRILATKMNLKIPVPDPLNYVPKIVSKLNLPRSIQEEVVSILQRAKKYPHLTVGKSPRGLAAAAIYISSILTDNRVTQRKVAKAAGVTEVTVRVRYKEIARELAITP
jgi:transcription initiation factor TFIIB